VEWCVPLVIEEAPWILRFYTAQGADEQCPQKSEHGKRKSESEKAKIGIPKINETYQITVVQGRNDSQYVQRTQ
jgi:hypothetical protein